MEHYSHIVRKKLKQFLHFVENSEQFFASCQKKIEALFAFGTKSESFLKRLTRFLQHREHQHNFANSIITVKFFSLYFLVIL